MKPYLLITIIIFSVCQIALSQDSVTVKFEVIIPESTPEDTQIFWAGSLNKWNPGNNIMPLSQPKPLNQNKGQWQIELLAPVGDTVRYKYTRGNIFSVEEQADFTYRPMRSVVFNQSKIIRDTIDAWHDRPPEPLRDQWPEIELTKTEKPVTINGTVMEGMGTLVTDKETGARFRDMSKYHTETTGRPEKIGEHVFYYLKVSDAPDNTILIMGGKSNIDSLWSVYIDRNNNNGIEPEELIFTIESDTSKKDWTGNVQIQNSKDKSIFTDSVKVRIDLATNLPKGYTSSVNPDAPDLFYQLPFKQRKGTLNGNTFYLTASFPDKFSKYFRLSVDRNHNDTLEIGSGSNEIYNIELNQMIRQQKFYMHPSFQLGNNFWEVVTLDEEGTSIRLRPAKNKTAKAEIAKGKQSPSWEASTVNGEKISSQLLKDKYVLLDFWGSWCGPCIEEIPLLQKMYSRFKSDNFEMIGFAYENKASLDNALQKYELPWPQVLDEKGNYSTKFLVQGYPTKYLIGPNGNILEIGNALRGKRLIPTLEKYLE